MGPHAWKTEGAGGVRPESVGSKGLVNGSLTRIHTWRGIRSPPPRHHQPHIPLAPCARLFFLTPAAPLPSCRCQWACALRGNNTHPTLLIPPTCTPLEVGRLCPPWHRFRLGTCRNPQNRCLRTTPSPFQPCSPAHEPRGPSANSRSHGYPLPPAELTPALTAPSPGSQTPGAAPKPLTHAPAS